METGNFKSASLYANNCSLMDVNCQSVCICNSGYFGSTCDITESEIQSRKVLQSTIVVSLRDDTRAFSRTDLASAVIAFN
jgi:hypothetical protein